MLFLEYIKQTAVVNPHASVTYVDPNGQRLNFPRVTKDLPKEPKRIKPHTPSADFKPSDTSILKSGMRVEHPKFGYGTVTEMDRDGANLKAKVNFENFGMKTLLLTFAKLRIVNNS